jgi:iron complex outermembrane recepter protein
VERVIVTGSYIPTAEETGPNPVDTYRPADIEKLGIRNATDLTTFLPQQSGATTNLNIGNGGDGTMQFNLRGLLPKETLVLVDGKRVAFGSLNPVGFSGGVDINLLPFPMIDHIDILKDGASAVYGSDAITGVVNFFLLHKFRGLEIGGSYGNTNLGASNDMGELEAWLKAGTGDDKTDIVVIADFWESGPAASSVVTGTCRLTRFTSPGADVIIALPLGLAACFLREASFCDRACISALAVHHSLA